MRIILLALASLALLAPVDAQQLRYRDVDVNGVARDYLLYLPAGYDGLTELPVMLVYHGGSMDAASMMLYADFRPLADAEGIILGYPQGLPDGAGDRIWNSEGPFSNGVDEIGFTGAVIDDLTANFAVDPSRVYACGYSNGANLMWELGCDLGDRIAAVGAVAGSMWTWAEAQCAPARPMPVLSIHGTFDFYNPYAGSPYSLGLIEASEFWATNAAADPVPVEVDLPDLVTSDFSTVTRFTWSGGDDCVSIEHYKVVRGGHDWPGTPGSNRDIDANQVIWDYVSQYDLDGRIDCCGVEKLGLGAGGANIADLDAATIPLLGSAFQLDIAGFPGAGTAYLVVSLRLDEQAFLGGTTFPDLAAVASRLPVAIDAAGSGSLSVPLGANPNLAGLTVYVQAGMPDSGQPAGWAFSNGLAATLCD